MLDIT